jgi:putative zinc finger protein
LVVTHDEHREALGAYVLDALEPWENRRVEEHLMSCADCQREFTELSAVPVLLAQLPTGAVLERYADEDLADVTPLPVQAPAPEPVPEPVAEPEPEPAPPAVLRPAARPRRPRWRLPARVRRPLTVGIAASVLVGGLTAGAVAVALTGSGKPNPSPTASASTTTRQLTGSNLGNASSGRAVLSTVGPNTEIYVSVSGLTPGAQYQWYVVNAAGSKQSLGNFAVPHDEYTGPASTQALTAIALKDIASIEIDDAGGQVVLTLTP